MSRVTHYGHGIFCEMCGEVYADTDACDHTLEPKMGVRKGRDGWVAQPADMGHHSPCTFMEIDGFEQCPECGKVKVPTEMVE